MCEMIDGLYSPEELLDVLYQKLQTNKIHAEKFFTKNSAPNHYLTFRRALNGRFFVMRTNEYVVICRRGSNQGLWRVFVVGLDDNYRFFCHNLPIEYLEKDLSNINDAFIRGAMGFDKHVWEASSVEQGDRIRVQGDLMVEVHRIFRSEEEMYHYIIMEFFESLCRDFFEHMFYDVAFRLMNDEISRGRFSKFLSYLKSYVFALIIDAMRGKIEILHDLFLRHNMLGEFSLMLKESKRDKLAFKLTDLVIDLLKNAARSISLRERRYRFSIGNHSILLIGVHRSSFPNETIIPASLRDNRRIITFRPQSILFLHDEHKAVNLDVGPCIISINTLNVGTAQVRRLEGTPEILVEVITDPLLYYHLSKRRKKVVRLSK